MSPPGARLLPIDGLRGIAALWVLGFHYVLRYDQMYDAPERFPFSFPDGEYGVCLFFIISGFVILMTLRAARTATDFAVSRFSRLFPAYWTAIALTATVGSLLPLPGQHYSLIQIVANATMLQKFLYVPDIDGVYWSLAYELGFYIVMLGLYLAGLLPRILMVAAAWLALAVADHLCRLQWDIGLPYRITLLFGLKYIPFFIAGIALHELRAGRGWPAAALLAAAIGAAFVASGQTLGLALLGFAALFAAAMWNRVPFLSSPPLVWLGSISYSLYLTHQMLGYRAIRALEAAGLSPAASVAVTTLAALALADAISRWIERPALQAIRAAYRRRRLAA